jgi:hypothetical protein
VSQWWSPPLGYTRLSRSSPEFESLTVSWTDQKIWLCIIKQTSGWEWVKNKKRVPMINDRIKSDCIKTDRIKSITDPSRTIRPYQYQCPSYRSSAIFSIFVRKIWCCLLKNKKPDHKWSHMSSDCSKPFLFFSLNRHMDSHNQKSVFCPVCGKALGSERILRDHTRKVHEKWRRPAGPPPGPRICTICNKQFSDMSCLQRHKRNIHKLVREPAQFLDTVLKDPAIWMLFKQWSNWCGLELRIYYLFFRHSKMKLLRLNIFQPFYNLCYQFKCLLYLCL